MRWTIRVIGLVSTMILARLLEPSDFGLVAMASITIGFIEVFISCGVDMALIQRQSTDRDDFDTAWTIRLIQGCGAAMLVIICTPLAVEYFREPRLAPILWALAAAVLIGSFSNIGTVFFRTELHFDREYRFAVSQKLLAFVTTVSAALMLRSYWALVIGSVVGTVLGTLLSYRVHSYRPRLCLKSTRKLWSFSQWMLLTNIGYFVETKSDELIVGGQLDSRQMGFYNVASEIAQLPTTEIAAPISRALIPGYARLQAELVRLKTAFISAFGMILMISLPLGLGIAMVASNAVLLLLGEKWVEIYPLVQVLALYGVIRLTYGSIVNLLVATGIMRTVALLTWCSVIALVTGAILVINIWGLIGVAMLKVALHLILLVVALRMLRTHLGIASDALLAVAWRPIVAGLVMIEALRTLSADPSSFLVINLVLQVAIGALAYLATLILLWILARRPEGAESFLLARCRELLGLRKI